jgi:NADPH:quinone reductase-like Zn-dependent oxidoreductase
MLPATMTAIEITRAGGPEVLVPTTRPVPQPAAGQVLIKVAYAGINRHDCGQRNRGFGPKGATDIPGLEVAGEVVAVGAGVARWKAGDPVCALVNGGGYAQYCLALQEVTFGQAQPAGAGDGWPHHPHQFGRHAGVQRAARRDHGQARGGVGLGAARV